MADTKPTKPAQEQSAPPIVFCPVCNTNTDAPGWGEQEFSCGNCETDFTVSLDPNKVAEHSIY